MKPSVERLTSTCPHDCPSACALEVERLDAHTIGRVYGAKDHPYTQGVICAKVGRYAERVHHPERLTTPLKRVGPWGVGRDAFAPISWEEALDTVAEQLISRTQRHGPETVWPFFYAGTMGFIQRDGIERLRHAMKYSRQHSTYCTTLADAGWNAGVGRKRGVDAREMEDADLIVIWGGNPVYTQVNVMHYVSRARRLRQAKLIVVDPYHTATAAKADQHLMLRPGTDGALACAVMQVLFAEGYADQEYLHQYTDFPLELEAHLAQRTPEWAAAITGLDAETIREFARLYGRTKRSYLRIGYGFTRSRNGAANMHAVSCLPAVTGAWQYPGGGALYSQSGGFGIDKTLIEGLDVLDPTVRLLDQCRIGPVLCHDPRDIGDGPPVTALLVQNTNPLAVAPESYRVREGLQREDLFVCVHEQFMTETAAMADIVLPATMFLEHEDMYQAGGHTFVQVHRPVIEAVGKCRSNHWVICELARRLGAEHPGFTMSAWELIEDALARSGLPDAATVADSAVEIPRDFTTGHFLNGFDYPDGRFRFQPDWQAQGPLWQQMPTLPDHLDNIDAPTPRYPLRLVTAPARQFLNSSFTETPGSRKAEGWPTVLIHPDDAQTYGIEDGQTVKLGNRLGSITLQANYFSGLQPGTLVVESIWPGSAFPEGVGINALVSAEPGPPNGGGVYHDTAVWIEGV